MATWLAEGAVREWQGPVGTLQRGGAFSPLPPGSPARYVATGGMRMLAQHVAQRLVQQHPGLVEVRARGFSWGAAVGS